MSHRSEVRTANQIPAALIEEFVAKTLTIRVPRVHGERIKGMLRETLGRDLTPAELRYLGLSTNLTSSPEAEGTRTRKLKLTA